MNALTTRESADLARLETIVKTGLDNFVKVGQALTEIRDRQLYRQEFGSFEAYCLDKFGFKKSQGYRLIDAARIHKITEKVSPNGGHFQSERQTRAIADQARKEVKQAQKPHDDVIKEIVQRVNAAQAKARKIKLAKRPPRDFVDLMRRHAQTIQKINFKIKTTLRKRIAVRVKALLAVLAKTRTIKPTPAE
jgi:hypothetical protein